MFKRPPVRDSEPRPPREMLRRLAYVAFVGSTAVGLILALAGATEHRLGRLVVGLALLALGGFLWWLGRYHLAFHELSDEIGRNPFKRETPPEDEQDGLL